MLMFTVLLVYFGRNLALQDKRLLLNDPDAVNSRLLNLERRLNLVETENVKLKQGLNLVETENVKLKQLISRRSGGTSFVRWGRKDCPVLNGTSLIYSGITAGNSHNEKGGGTNVLCLPHDPDAAPKDFPTRLEQPGMVARVWGSEYQFSYKNVAQDDDIPCAVCQINDASSSIMIPGKTSCPTEWKRQYNGLLCADHYGYSSSEYVCLDENPQYFEGRRQDLNGKLFYPAATVCGSLPCPPYVNAKYITCAVCSK